MALLCVLGHTILAQTDTSFMEAYIKLKFKMKLSYECWKNKTNFDQLVMQAIEKTVAEKFIFARNDIHKFLSNEDGGAPFQNYSDNSGCEYKDQDDMDLETIAA